MTLAHYYRSKPVVVETDASEYSLGATLIQSGWPITFVSKTFTDVETRYANIESQILSVYFGLGKFCTYLYSRHIIMQNNHKPLEMIQHTPIFLSLLTCSSCYFACRI